MQVGEYDGKIDLKLKTINGNYDLTREPYIAEILKRLENGDDVFVKFDKNDKKRPNAIAKIKKMEGEGPSTNPRWRSGVSNYTVYLKWDGRKNSAKVDLGDSYSPKLSYLRDYTGDTVWTIFDKEEFTKKHSKPVLDRLGKEINVDDTVVYINARYGAGTELDFGVVREIERKPYNNYQGQGIETTVIIETIAKNNGSTTMKSKIKKTNKSIMVITDVDLLNEALIAKLSIN